MDGLFFQYSTIGRNGGIPPKLDFITLTLGGGSLFEQELRFFC